MSFFIHRPRFFYTKKYLFPLLVCCLSALLFASRSSIKNSYYFKTLPGHASLASTINRVPEIRIQKNDQLSINISSLNPAEDAVFNAPAGMGGATALSGTTGAAGGYTVNIPGNIQIHRLV